MLHRATAAADLWFSPPTKDATPPHQSDGDTPATMTDDHDARDDDDDGDDTYLVMVDKPSAHKQLLSDDRAYSADLKGHYHARGFAWDHDHLHEACQQKLSAVKQQGGGSWLLGSLTLLKVELEDSEEGDARTPPPGLCCASDGSDEDARTP